MTIVSVAVMGLFMGYRFLRRQQHKDEFDRDLRLREFELQRALAVRNATATSSSGGEDGIPSGFLFFEVDDEYKSLFSDAINGFKEYARLRGYNISLAIDTSLPEQSWSQSSNR
jgi:hypothetical protein